MINLNFVTLPLTTQVKNDICVAARSGLNWGQRPGRNGNQAYISIPADIQRSGFFPDVGIAFQLECDDGYKMMCVRAQQNGKALHSHQDNALMGSYFRKRLGLISGQLIIVQHLYNYGRLSVDISKNGNLYYLDFSNKK
mgnify:CR=1 FL=1